MLSAAQTSFLRPRGPGAGSDQTCPALANTLHALLQRPELDSVAAALCDELAGDPALACAWVGVKGPDSDFETAALAGEGRTAAAFREPGEPWIGGRSSGPALPAVVAGRPTLIDAADAALRVWRPALAADAVGAFLGLPFPLSSQRLGVALLAVRDSSTWKDDHWLALGEKIAWLFGRLDHLQRQQLLEDALQAAGNSMFITDEQARIVWVNPAFCALTGYEEREVLGKNPRILKSGRQSQRYYRDLWQRIRGGHVWTGETIDRDKYGYTYAIHQSISPVARRGEITHFLSVHEDISQRRARRWERDRAHPVDARSGLLNATSFLDRLSEELCAAAASEDVFFVVSLRLQSLALATDSQAPDGLGGQLRVVGERIRAGLGRRDAAAHVGDADFMLLLATTRSRTEAQAAVDGIVSALQAPVPGSGETLYLSPQYGFAEFPGDGQDARALWQAAEDASLAPA